MQTIRRVLVQFVDGRFLAGFGLGMYTAAIILQVLLFQ